MSALPFEQSGPGKHFSLFFNKFRHLFLQIGAINSCPLVYVDGIEGQETLVLEHMKQHGWKDATNKKKGSAIVAFINELPFKPS